MLLFTGGNDALCAPKDIDVLFKALPAHAKTVEVKDYNHLDYMWAADVNKNINDEVMDFLKSL